MRPDKTCLAVRFPTRWHPPYPDQTKSPLRWHMTHDTNASSYGLHFARFCGRARFRPLLISGTERDATISQRTSSCITTSSDSSSSSQSMKTSKHLSLLLRELTARSRNFCACCLHRAWKRSLRNTFWGSSDVWLPARKRGFTEVGVTGER